MVSGGLVLAPAASAVPSLSVTGTSVTTVGSNTTTTLAGYAFANAQSGDTLQVTIATDVGSLTLPTTTGLTLAYGYTAYSGATISFTGNQVDINTDLASLQLVSGANSGKTAHITVNAFTQQQNLTYSAPNQHFYEYVPSTNITWSAAATAASSKTYGGLQGYIATIPNDAVNNFVGSKIQGATNVWFGARSYSNTGGYARLWKWYAGPLVGQTVSACTAATGACSFSTGTDGLNGNAYSHWASGEPNNAGSTENSAVTNWSGSIGNWNDLADSSSNISGYLVEYGDLATGYTVAPAGTASVSNSITITGPPSAPVGPTASLSGTTATVSWTAPTNSGYGTVSGYTVTASPGGATCTPNPATATGCQIGGLTKGTPYTFAVTATNEFGTGAAATTAAVTPRSVPGAPTATVSGHGNGSLQLSIIPPVDNGGATITRYQASTDGGTTWNTLTTSGTSPLTASISGLVNGTSYPVIVRASNSQGDGAASAAVNGTPSTAASAPTGVTVTPGDSEASVAFTPPASDGGEPITGYTVTANPGGLTATCVGSPCVVTGLTNGTAYTFTVKANNANGASTSSATSNSVVPALVPDAPTDVTAVFGDTEATVSFTAPAFDGGSTITGYTVTSAPGGLTAFCAMSPCTVTGLANGTPYTFTAVATNPIGNSVASAASAAVTPAGVPNAPTDVDATRAAGSAVVTFTAPVNSHGAPVTSYTVTSAPDGITQVCTASPCTVTGLSNGTAYTFTVQATNAAGDSVASAPSSAVTPATVPGAPTGVTAVAGSGQAEVAFAVPSDDGGSAITSYTVVSSPGGITAVCTSSPCVVSGLTNGTSYTFGVYATNGVGASANSTSSAALTPASAPGTPSGVTVARNGASATISWLAPNNGGAPVTGYAVSVSPGGATCTPDPATATSCVVTGLNPIGDYTASVTATNVAGTGTGGTAAIVAATAPSAPSTLTAAPTTDGEGVVLSWTAPTDSNGSAVSSYTVVSSPAGLSCTPSPATATTCTISPIPYGVDYTFSVLAGNVVGASTPATASFNRLGVPTVPVAPEYTPTRTGFGIFFHKPLSDRGSAILGYRVSLNGGATWQDLTYRGPVTGPYTASVSGLNPDSAYTVRLQAYNAIGLGEANRPPAIVRTLPLAVPSVSIGLEVTPAKGSLKLFWHKPLDEGGTPITGYRVSLDGGSTWQPPLKVYGPASGPYTATVAGLVPGRSYAVRIQAWNAVGYGGAPRVPVVVAPN